MTVLEWLSLAGMAAFFIALFWDDARQRRHHRRQHDFHRAANRATHQRKGVSP